jgi:hypothetical protein
LGYTAIATAIYPLYILVIYQSNLSHSIYYPRKPLRGGQFELKKIKPADRSLRV